ncbi:MAG: 3-methyl-2-oxobutanoate hydroxymethyltransferase [Coriobacteriia bacterium]
MSVHDAGPRHRVTTAYFAEKKAAGERLVVITAYDEPSARLADEAGVDAILVGDSLGMTVLGYPDTLSVTMDDMLHHVAAVSRGCERAMVIADMPFMSFQVSEEEALRNAGRFLAEAGAAAVKLEGGRRVESTVRRLVEAGIPVMGHVGLTPQSVHALGGYRIQAREAAAALALIEDCRALESAGAFSVVLECIPAELAELVTEALSIPTIGIGAGLGCDGEVQVFHDLVGLSPRTPRHANKYAEVGQAIRDAVERYAADVRERAFPQEANTTRMDPAVLEQVREAVGSKRTGP